jgi:hypothetical protein
MTQVAEYLPSKSEAMSTNPSASQKQKQTKKQPLFFIFLNCILFQKKFP